MISKLKKSVLSTACAVALAVVPVRFVNATGIPVVDALSNAQQLIDYAEQLLMYAKQVDQYQQQLTDYALEIQNLQALGGTIRGDIKTTVTNQLVKVTTDFGASAGFQDLNMNPDQANYYANLENKLTAAYGNVTRTTAAMNTALAALGVPSVTNDPLYAANIADRKKHALVMDSIRLAHQTINNAQKRSGVANGISEAMKNMPSNNTVGAIQVLGAQNALTYSQIEDLLKVNAANLKLAQDEEARALANRELIRTNQLNAIQKAKTERNTPVPSVALY
jgi:conjugal transfer/entry exclusion protein